MLLALTAPAVSLLPALTTGPRGSGPAVSFPHGYAVTLIATVAVTAAACALGGFISRRAGLMTIPFGLGLWAVAGLGVTAAGLSLGHADLAGWGIVLLTAAAAGTVPACWSRRGTLTRTRRLARLAGHEWRSAFPW